MTSVLAPFTTTTSATNVWGRPSGTGCAVGLASLAGMAAAALLSGPVILVGWLGSRHPVALGIAVALSVAYGLVVWQAGLSLAARRLNGRYPEMLERLSPRV